MNGNRQVLFASSSGIKESQTTLSSMISFQFLGEVTSTSSIHLANVNFGHISSKKLMLKSLVLTQSSKVA
jgi:hypothetical protein